MRTALLPARPGTVAVLPALVAAPGPGPGYNDTWMPSPKYRTLLR